MGTNYYRKSDGKHIGKQSAGWSFQFRDYGFESFSQAKQWIDDDEIVDEYGRNIDNVDFWDMVNGAYFDRHTYSQKPIVNIRKLDGHDFDDGDFC